MGIVIAVSGPPTVIVFDECLINDEHSIDEIPFLPTRDIYEETTSVADSIEIARERCPLLFTPWPDDMVGEEDDSESVTEADYFSDMEYDLPTNDSPESERIPSKVFVDRRRRTTPGGDTVDPFDDKDGYHYETYDDEKDSDCEEEDDDDSILFPPLIDSFGFLCKYRGPQRYQVFPAESN